MLIVRPEHPGDHPDVRRINRLAFGRTGEADLVDRLRSTADPYLSYVASVRGECVGHIFFSPVEVEGEGSRFTALALAPMAVLPGYQGRGIGTELVRRGLEACRTSGHEVVFVLGHPAFYPRFGFRPAGEVGFSCTFDVPAEVFMVAELTPGALAGRTGVVRYHPAFDDVA